MRIVKGVSVASGLALGPVHVVHTTPNVVPTWSVAEEEVPREIERLREAVEIATENLKSREKIVAAEVGERDAAVFSVHRTILQDPSTAKDVENMIREQRINAESAVQTLIERFHKSLSGVQGAKARGFAADFSDPWRVVLDALMSHEREVMEQTDEQVVLAAAELTPQVVTFLPRERVLAVVAETGGRYSHGAVLARSFGFPCVVGLPNLLSRLEQGMRISVDGDAGTVQLRPEKEDVDRFLSLLEQRKERVKKLSQHAALPAQTSDGHRLETMVNIESIRDLDTFNPEHTDGVGLLRTEFLYMERSQFPSEEEQYRLYRRVLERMGRRQVTLRTLDIGNDKQLSYFKTPKENNPALGWRGLRISIEWQDLLRVQLRAALRASAHGNMRILLPMVTSIEEVREVHRIFDGVRRQLADQGFEIPSDVPVGIMVEVPSSVFVLPHLVKEIDFVSVGTNDLVQYLLAVDRDNPWVSKLYDVSHPAVLMALAQVARVAGEAGKPCSVCGEMASDYATALMMLGMGYDAVSVVPSLLPEVKYAVRETSHAEAVQIAALALAETTSEGVRRVLTQARERLHVRQTAMVRGAAEVAAVPELRGDSKKREKG
ncbi:MAG: phosphoenolpyruvate--protein phosphotransferase [Planctomycetes bacterium]|nr:phosphoenolpyruvate--protein phosphotransferase [Planctomycetota bacterium]